MAADARTLNYGGKYSYVEFDEISEETGMKNKLEIKRVYDLPTTEDGYRILVDRLWPRGVSKEKAKINLWLKDIAPSDQLRKWFSHDSSKWEDFKYRYFKELDKKKDLVNRNFKNTKSVITLLYAAKDDRYNNAQALKEYIGAR